MAAVFVADERQRAAAERSRAELEKTLGRKVETQVLPLTRFYRAEDYHQKYSLRQSAAVLKVLKERFKTDQELVDSTLAARLNAFLAGHGKPEELRAELAKLGLDPADVEKVHGAACKVR
jgi:peptide-methionine (S)-S-oxide reductase